MFSQNLIFKTKIDNLKNIIEKKAIKEHSNPSIDVKFLLTDSNTIEITDAIIYVKVPVKHQETWYEYLLSKIGLNFWKKRFQNKYKDTDLPINTPEFYDVIEKEFSLNQEIYEYGMHPYTKDLLIEALRRKKSMDLKDMERIELQNEMNTLESLIYNGRDIIEEEEKSDEDKIVISVEERNNYKEFFTNLLNELFDGEVYKLSLNELKKKKESINNVIDLIKRRRNEIRSRESIIEQFQKFLQETRTLYEAMDNISEKKMKEKENEAGQNGNNNEFNEEFEEVNDDKENEESQEALAERLSGKIKSIYNEAESWLKENLDKQALLKSWEEPIFTKADVEKKVINMYNKVTKIIEEGKSKNSSSKAKQTNSSTHSDNTNDTKAKEAENTSTETERDTEAKLSENINTNTDTETTDSNNNNSNTETNENENENDNTNKNTENENNQETDNQEVKESKEKIIQEEL